MHCSLVFKAKQTDTGFPESTAHCTRKRQDQHTHKEKMQQTAYPQVIPTAGFPVLQQAGSPGWANRNHPPEVVEMFAAMQNLFRPELREKAIMLLAKNRDKYTTGGPALWYSVGVMPIFLQEIIAIYPMLDVATQSSAVKSAVNRVSSVLALVQTVAQHDISRQPFMDSGFCMFLYPILRAKLNEKTEIVRLTSLGVIGSLFKTPSPTVVPYLLNSEIFPLCLQIMESAPEVSKTMATVVVSKILQSDLGLQYACQTPSRFTAVAKVLNLMITETNKEGEHQCSARLLRQVIRCYLRLSENPMACKEGIPKTLPRELRDSTFLSYYEKDESMKKAMLQLLHNIGESKVTKDSASHTA